MRGITLRRTPTLLALSLVAVLLVLPRGGSAEKYPANVTSTIEADLALLKAGVEKKAKTSVRPLKSLAMLIALNAQNQLDGDKGEAMAGVRDQALAVAAALSKSDADWAEALKAVEAASSAKGDAKKVVKLVEATEFDVHELMTIFKPKNRGGQGFEQTLLSQVKSASDPKLVADMASKMYLIADYSEQLTSTVATGAANEKKWKDHVAEMKKVAAETLEVATAATVDKPALKAKLKLMELNCTACHKDFRN